MSNIRTIKDRENNQNYVEVRGRIKKITARGGLLLAMADAEEEQETGAIDIWFPLSQIHNDKEELIEGAEVDLLIPEWLAKNKGVI